MKRQVPFQGLELPTVDETDEVVRRDRFTNLSGRLSIFGWDLFFDSRVDNGSQCLMTRPMSSISTVLLSKYAAATSAVSVTKSVSDSVIVGP